MLRRLFYTLMLLFCFYFSYGQKEMVLENGVVSYTSSQNVYVKFLSTEHINKGDTLFLQKEAQLLPALVVKDKSSTSCVCASLLTEKVKVGDAFIAKSLVEKKIEKPKDKKIREMPSAVQDSTIKPAPLVKVPDAEDKEEHKSVRVSKPKGRISAASYSNVYGDDVTHRMRYTLTYQGNNIKKSRFSTDNYISFRHTIGEWDKVKGHLGDALKVYSLSVKYDLDKTSSISLGRKINYRISSMGAIDGVQYEKGFGRFLFGAIGGWRPDYADYGFNAHLFQAGGYVSFISGKTTKTQENTLAFVEQMNHSKTDRRFVYFQHTNTLLKNLSLFSSFEVDLYQEINNEITNRPSLTNLLFSLRYKVNKKISLSASYDNRKNIIYYESYKNYIDQLIDDETRQGLRFGATHHVSKLISLGFNTGWRFQKSNLNLSENLNAYLNFSRLPWMKGTASLTGNLLKTNYLDSKMYSAQVSKEILPSKLQGEFYYRWVEYNYKNYENKIQQQIAGVNMSWYITRKFAFFVYYEGTFDKKNKTFSRVNTKLIQRF